MERRLTPVLEQSERPCERRKGTRRVLPERISDWVERIGWPRFFEVTELPFIKFHIDNWCGQQKRLKASTHLRF